MAKRNQFEGTVFSGRKAFPGLSEAKDQISHRPSRYLATAAAALAEIAADIEVRFAGDARNEPVARELAGKYRQAARKVAEAADVIAKATAEY